MTCKPGKEKNRERESKDTDGRKERTKMLTIERGRPADTAGRQEKEIAVYDLLDRLCIPYERVDHEAAFTMEACREVDLALAPAVMCKNLLLCNAQKTDFYLLMIRGDKKLHTREISGQIHSSRLSFAPPEQMEALLDIAPGSLSVLGLMNDPSECVRLLIDADLLAAEQFGAHPCVNTSSLRLRMRDLLDVFLPAVRHTYRTVELQA